MLHLGYVDHNIPRFQRERKKTENTASILLLESRIDSETNEFDIVALKSSHPKFDRLGQY